MRKGRILVVDDLSDVRRTLNGVLGDNGYAVSLASSKDEALQILGTDEFDLALLDVRLDETDEKNQDGLSLMYEVRKIYPAVVIIMLSGYAEVKIVREALQHDANGISPAFDFVEKGDMEHILEYVERAFAYRRHNGLSISSLIAEGENEQLEFKSSIRWDYKLQAVNKALQEVIAVAIAGLLNSKGGNLLIGVSDNGTVLGIEKDLETLHKKDLDGFQLAVNDIVKTYLGVEYISQIHIGFEHIGDQQVCILSVDKSPIPVFFTKGDENKFWVRMGNSTHWLDVKAATSYINTNWKKPV